MLSVIRHIGAEVVHLPVMRDREVRRIKPAIDHHHPELTNLAIRRAGVEIANQRKALTRQTGHRGSQIALIGNQVEMTTDVKAG